jgi:YVTN family beta-propeller protein
MFRAAALFVAIIAISARADDKPTPKTDSQATFPGPTATGFLLPNGWHITPAGRQVEITDLPLNIHPLSDGRSVIVTTNGFNQHQLSLIDLAEGKVVASEWARQSWFGLAVSKAEDKMWWSGGGNGFLHSFEFQNGAFTRLSKKEVNPGDLKVEDVLKIADELEKKKTFKSGLCLDEARGVLYSLDINAGTISAIDLKAPRRDKPREGTLGGRPYDVVVGKGGNLLYVSDWAHRQVLAVDPGELRIVARIPVGEHPNQIAAHPKDGRLFVACASSDSVHVIDPKRGIVTEVIATGLFPKAPEGSTPDAVAVAPDGKTLYVANADNNCVAVVDIEKPNQSIVKGFIPTGWYPTAVSVTPDSKTILVGVGKGNQSRPNPLYTKEELAKRDKDEVKQLAKRLLPYPYIGTTLSGALSIVPVPSEQELKAYTAQVFKNCPYADSQLTAAPHVAPTAIPTRVGDASPIKYIIYIIKENRTYDQVFGDLAAGAAPKGNGDPTLCMFPRKVTPNHHKLAEEFVLLDNLYCNGQVSRDGHPWSTAAYHTDYIARDWHLTYSARKGVDDDDDGDLSNPPSGYLWDSCKRVGVSYRSYGEYGKRVSDGMGGNRMEARVPGLVGHMSPDFGVSKQKGKKLRDTENVEIFLNEYNQFVKDGAMPRFIVMSLGEDHTEATKFGAYTPQACVASNDLALGKLVEAVSHGPLWRETAIFVIEDDAQNGPDHVDAHRTVGLVISPYTRRKFVDSTQYQTVSMIRTMELFLGLPPLSQYDAAARPMFNSFTDKADATAYQHEPAQIDLDAKNDKAAFGFELSNKMDFSDYDRVNDFEMNYVLWHAVMGKDAPQPPAVRRAIAFRAVRDGKK